MHVLAETPTEHGGGRAIRQLRPNTAPSGAASPNRPPFPNVGLALVCSEMATPARTGVLSAAAGWTRAAAWAPDWRSAFSAALASEVEQRRFFLWIPVAAMSGVALNLAADREPVLWLPGLMT